MVTPSQTPPVVVKPLPQTAPNRPINRHHNVAVVTGKNFYEATTFRNIYSPTANQIDDPLVFFQTHSYHATT